MKNNDALDADIIDLRACLEAAEFDKNSYAMELLRKIENRYTCPQPCADAVKLQAYQKAINRIDDLMEYRGMSKEDFTGIMAGLCNELNAALTQPLKPNAEFTKAWDEGRLMMRNDLTGDMEVVPQPKADVDVLKSRDPIKALDFLVSMANDGLTHHSQRGAPEMAADDIRDALAKRYPDIKPKATMTHNDGEWKLTDGISTGYGNTPEAASDAFREDKSFKASKYKFDVDLMTSAYEEERAKYIGGTAYYPNNQAAFIGCMNKALAAQGYIGVPEGYVLYSKRNYKRADDMFQFFNHKKMVQEFNEWRAAPKKEG